MESYGLNPPETVNKKAIPKNGPAIFAKSFPSEREKSKFKPPNWEKATEIKFYPIPITLDKSIDTACG